MSLNKEKLNSALKEIGLPESIAKNMSLKLTAVSRKDLGLRGQYNTGDKWGEIKKRTRKRKLSLKAKAAGRKMRKTLKSRKKKETSGNKDTVHRIRV